MSDIFDKFRDAPASFRRGIQRIADAPSVGEGVSRFASGALDLEGEAWDVLTEVNNLPILNQFLDDYEYEPGQGKDYAESLRGDSAGESLLNMATDLPIEGGKRFLESSLLGTQAKLAKGGLRMLGAMSPTVASGVSNAAGGLSKFLMNHKLGTGLAGLGIYGNIRDAEDETNGGGKAAPVAEEKLEVPTKANFKLGDDPYAMIRPELEGKPVPGGNYSKMAPGTSARANQRYARTLLDASGMLDEINQNFETVRAESESRMLQMYDRDGVFAKHIDSLVNSDLVGLDPKERAKIESSSEMDERRVEKIRELARGDAARRAYPKEFIGALGIDISGAPRSTLPAAVELAEGPSEEERESDVGLGTYLGMAGLLGASIYGARRGKISAKLKPAVDKLLKRARPIDWQMQGKLKDLGTKVDAKGIRNARVAERADKLMKSKAAGKAAKLKAAKEGGLPAPAERKGLPAAAERKGLPAPKGVVEEVEGEIVNSTPISIGPNAKQLRGAIRSSKVEKKLAELTKSPKLKGLPKGSERLALPGPTLEAKLESIAPQLTGPSGKALREAIRDGRVMDLLKKSGLDKKGLMPPGDRQWIDDLISLAKTNPELFRPK